MIPSVRYGWWYFYAHSVVATVATGEEVGLLGTGVQITAIICISVLVALKMMLNSIDKDKKG